MVESYKISGFDALIASITDPEPTPETPVENAEETPGETRSAKKKTTKK